MDRRVAQLHPRDEQHLLWMAEGCVEPFREPSHDSQADQYELLIAKARTYLALMLPGGDSDIGSGLRTVFPLRWEMILASSQ